MAKFEYIFQSKAPEDRLTTLAEFWPEEFGPDGPHTRSGCYILVETPLKGVPHPCRPKAEVMAEFEAIYQGYTDIGYNIETGERL